MYLSKNASASRRREAANARNNRLEIVKALSHGQISRRDLIRWGLFTVTGALALKNGLSPYARSAYAAVPTGTLPSPAFGAVKFDTPLPRPNIPAPIPMQRIDGSDAYAWMAPGGANLELPTRRLSYHTAFTQSGGALFRNPVTNVGPIEGRPPGEMFAFQRWNEPDLAPKIGYLLSIGQAKANQRFHAGMPAQDKNSVWTFGARQPGLLGALAGTQTGSLTPTLLRMRYGEPMVTRIYNDLPDDKTLNNGFGRNEISTHFHNAHNGAESDGACNAYHFPGTFYDYHWGMTVARRDLPAVWPTTVPGWKAKCSGPNDLNGINEVRGDFRELQGSMWFHDHRFFFTAENVHKGNFALANIYSGPDRGCELPCDTGVNLRLPSGKFRKWGNVDFDVNLCISNPATDQQGQLFWDIFDTDGFLGDILAVNGAYYPYFEVLPRRYRFRLLNASMARFIQLALAVTKSSRMAVNTKVPVWVIATDGNLLPSPIRLTDIDVQGVAERFDIIVDFSAFRAGEEIDLVNVLKQTDGRHPEDDKPFSIAQARAGDPEDPCVGSILRFVVRDRVQSVDNPGYEYLNGRASDRDESADFNQLDWRIRRKTLTTQIPIVAPVRVREFEFARSGSNDPRDTPDGQCVPECGDYEQFPWSVKVNGQSAHGLNANRISALIPKPGEVEHWVFSTGGGWDHPIHLHFEEAVTIDRAGDPIHPTERLARKDVWRLKKNSSKRTVRVQVRFGEFGGAYVAHCHNTTHEDFAMLMRYQLLAGDPNSPQYGPTLTPIPTRAGVQWKTPEILPEGDPRPRQTAQN